MKIDATTKLRLLAALAAVLLGVVAPTLAQTKAPPTQAQTKKAPAGPATKPWTKEPDSFRDAKFLSSESEVRSKFEFGECAADNPRERICPFEFLLTDVNLGGLLTFSTVVPTTTAFVETRAVFDPNDFSTVRAVFVERYGEPTSTVGDRLLWTGKSVSIELMKSAPADFKQVVSYAGSVPYGRLLDTVTATLKRKLAYVYGVRKIKREGELQQSSIGVSRYELDRARNKADQELQTGIVEANRAAEKSSSEAKIWVDKFESADHSGFSITTNSYAAEVERRKVDTQKKGAGVL